MTPQRQSHEERLKQLLAEKKAAKGTDDVAFVKCAEAVVSLLDEIGKLPEDNVLTDFEIGTYCWSIQAIAAKSRDPARRREAASRLVVAFRKAADSPQFWGDSRSCEFGRVLFNSMVTTLYKVVKTSNAEAGESVLRKAGRAFAEILAMRADAYLDDSAFKKPPVTDEQRAAMQRDNGGKVVRLKSWPSVAEKAFGLLNRCLKADAGLIVPQGLVSLLYQRREKGDWLGFYCANALIRCGHHEDAKKLLVEIVRRKPGEFWAWTHLAEACRGNPPDAVSCLCKALGCRIGDHEIEGAVKAKIHRQLSRMYAAVGEDAAAAREAGYANGVDVSAEDAARYESESRAANVLVFGGESPAGGGCVDRQRNGGRVKFSGFLIKPAGKEYGFVKSREAGDVFIPPSFASGLKNGERVAGWAMLKEDRKKHRMAYCMVAAL